MPIASDGRHTPPHRIIIEMKIERNNNNNTKYTKNIQFLLNINQTQLNKCTVFMSIPSVFAMYSTTHLQKPRQIATGI